MKQPLRVSLSRFALLVWLAAGALSQMPQTGTAQTPPAPAAAPAQSAPATPPAAVPIPANAPEMSLKDAPALFKARVDMVSVPVVVRDNKGRTLATFTKENFQVFDKGKLQEIVRFAVEKSGDQIARAAKTALPTEGDPAAPPDIPERFVAYLFDDMHLEWADLIRARDAAGRQLSKLAKTDRAAIYTTSGQDIVEFTDDVDKLQADLMLLRNRSISNLGGITQCPDISYFMADMIINKSDTSTLNLAAQETLMCMGLDPSAISSAQSIAQGKAQQVLSVGTQETHVTYAVLKDTVRRMASMPGSASSYWYRRALFRRRSTSPTRTIFSTRPLKPAWSLTPWMRAAFGWIQWWMPAVRAAPPPQLFKSRSRRTIA